ncbi:hypothetical protein [Bradyrhizobium prioriisuperbiae]|uniref:hypothetical protein n=1 Tax=Bradyrhizobium prioriisuperbiae TaxID=2854389 RepID=UPI0028EB0F18|nr:hypothetical protein [Bradyrhizobium prioritasuperba]
MKVLSALIACLALIPGQAVAQGMYPLNPALGTVNQQRQNQYTVSPNSPTTTFPTNDTFRSPFVSPFSTGSYPSRTGGYVSSYTGSYAGTGPR